MCQGGGSDEGPAPLVRPVADGQQQTQEETVQQPEMQTPGEQVPQPEPQAQSQDVAEVQNHHESVPEMTLQAEEQVQVQPEPPKVPKTEGESEGKVEPSTQEVKTQKEPEILPKVESLSQSKPQTPQDDSPHQETSGEEESFVPPDDQTAQRIIDQVEFYFSDENITRDPFLLKHVKRNKEGYVSLKLISGFKKVKQLAKDWRVVAYALAKSKKMEINKEGTKLRRVDPLPPFDQTTPSRTVVAIDLPQEKSSIESVAEVFRVCGEIALIRILRPGNPIPADVRSFVNKHPEVNGKISALIEFERTESAHDAIQRDFKLKNSEKLVVLEFNSPPTVDKNRKIKSIKTFEMDYSSSCASGSEAEDRRYRLQRRCSSPHLMHDGPWAQRRWSRDSGSESSGSYSRSRSNSGVYPIPDYIRRMSSDSCGDPYSSSSSSRGSVGEIRRLSVSSRDSDCCCCHTDYRRRGSLGSGSEGYGSARNRSNSGQSEGGCSSRRGSLEYYIPKEKGIDGRWGHDGYHEQHQKRQHTHQEQERMRNKENVIRMPRGPDGGRGFLPSKPSYHTLIE